MMVRLGPLLDRVARPRIGVEVGSTIVRGVLIVRGRILEKSLAPLDNRDGLGGAVGAVLDSMRQRFWRKPRVCIAVGASMSQLRRLGELPAVKSDRVLRDLIRNNASRFFLKSGVPLLTSLASREEHGESWAAALDEPPVRTVAEACQSRRLRLDIASPAVVALQYALTDTTLVTRDGDVVVEAHVGAKGALSHVRRRAHIDEQTRSIATPVDPIRSLGESAIEYSVAYGAAVVDNREPLAIHRCELRHWDNVRVATRRFALAVAALVTSTGMMLVLPGIYARRVAGRATTDLAAINSQYREAHWTENELQRTNASLKEIRTFQDQRRSVLAFLSEMSEALPDGVWLQSLHVDQEGGVLTALAPRAASAIDALSNVKSILSATIVGGVSSEQSGLDRVERVTIRFRWKPSKAGGVNASSAGGRGV